MKIFNKIVIGLVLLTNLHSSIFTMEQPEGLTKKDSDLLNKFLISNSYKNPAFISTRSDTDLQKVISISNDVINSPRKLENLSNYMKPSSKKNLDINKILNEIVDVTTQELKKRKLDIPQKVCPAPALQPKVIEPKQIAAISKPQSMYLNPNKTGTGRMHFLYNFIEAEINGDENYINSRPISTYNLVIETAKTALADNGKLAVIKEVTNLSEKQLKELLVRVMQDATEGLERAQEKENMPILEKEAPKIIPVPQQIIPEAVKAPVALAEQPEEEIRPNKLYIGLDIKERNSKGQQIRWETPINGMIAKINNNAQFDPNDYFHITIAWYETKKAIDPAIVAKFERALAHATEILKIVFPTGVHGISLLDGAVLLGQNAVAFRVAESADLKKMQDIFLKFLSFENIEGIKFSTFNKATPIHVTLGKIWPAKTAQQFQNSVTTLSAPDGARASQGQSFAINTFRLTYTVAGQAWQEKMSYKF